MALVPPSLAGDYILPLTSQRADLQSNGSDPLRFDCGLRAFTWIFRITIAAHCVMTCLPSPARGTDYSD